jgi:hypothetical protein
VWNEGVVVTRVHDDANATRRCIGCEFGHKGHRSAHDGLTSIRPYVDAHALLLTQGLDETFTRVRHALLDSDLYSLGS